MNPIKTNHLIARVVPVVLASAAVIACLAQSRHVAHSQDAPTHLLVGFDTSGSCATHLSDSARLLLSLASQLNPQIDWITAFRVDRSLNEFYDDVVPESADDMQGALVRELSPRSSRVGTFPGAFWQEVARRADEGQARCIIILFSDGDNDAGSASETEIRQAAVRLAHNPHVSSVCIFGASHTNWARLRSEFAPLGGRLVLRTQSELSPEAVARCLNAAQ